MRSIEHDEDADDQQGKTGVHDAGDRAAGHLQAGGLHLLESGQLQKKGRPVFWQNRQRRYGIIKKGFLPLAHALIQVDALLAQHLDKHLRQRIAQEIQIQRGRILKAFGRHHRPGSLDHRRETAPHEQFDQIQADLIEIALQIRIVSQWRGSRQQLAQTDRVAQPGVEPQKSFEAVIRVHRDVQVTERGARLVTHPADVKPAVFHLHRGHVIEIFPRFAGHVAQLETEAGTKTAKLAVAGLAIELRQQVVQAEIVQLQTQGAGRSRNAERLTHRALNGDRFRLREGQRPDAQFQIGPAVAEIGLVEGVAAIGQGVVDPDFRLQRLVAQVFLIVNPHLTEKGLGLAGGVVLDLEVQQLDGERQFLQQKAVAHSQEHEIGGAALGQHDVAAKCRHRARRQPTGRWDVARHQVAGLDHDLAAPFLEFQPQIAVQQTADPNHHHRGVGK